MKRSTNFFLLCSLFLLSGLIWSAAINALDYQMSLDDVKQSLRDNPKDPNVWYDAGNWFYEQGEYKQAVRYLKKSLSLDEENARALFKLGNAYFRLEKLDHAARAYEAIIALDDRYAGPHINLATIYEQQEEYGLAFQEYKKVRTLAPDAPDAYNGMGDVCLAVEKWEMAQGYYKQALERMDPGSSDLEIRKNRQITLQNLKRVENALGNDGVVPADQMASEDENRPQTRGFTDQALEADKDLYVLRKIYFAPNAYTMDSLDLNGRQQLKELAKALKNMDARKGRALWIEGHADKEEAAGQAEKLARMRAEAVQFFLEIENGVDNHPIKIANLGAQKNYSGEEMPEWQDLNRRVVIRWGDEEKAPAARKETPEIHLARAESTETLLAGLEEPAVGERAIQRVGVQILYKVNDQDKPKPLGPQAELPADASYQIVFNSQTDQYLYVLRQEQREWWRCLFPEPGRTGSRERLLNNPVQVQKAYTLPTSTQFYRAPKSGQSLKIQVYASAKPLDTLDQIFAQGTQVGGAQTNTRGFSPVPERDRPVTEPAGPLLNNQTLDELPPPNNEIEIQVR